MKRNKKKKWRRGDLQRWWQTELELSEVRWLRFYKEKKE
jgi:hypothetical protein